MSLPGSNDANMYPGNRDDAFVPTPLPLRENHDVRSVSTAQNASIPLPISPKYAAGSALGLVDIAYQFTLLPPPIHIGKPGALIG